MDRARALRAAFSPGLRIPFTGIWAKHLFDCRKRYWVSPAIMFSKPMYADEGFYITLVFLCFVCQIRFYRGCSSD